MKNIFLFIFVFISFSAISQPIPKPTTPGTNIGLIGVGTDASPYVLNAAKDSLNLTLLSFVVPDSVVVIGHSYYQGTGGYVSGTGFRTATSDTTVSTYLTADWGIPFINQALGGSGSWRAAANFNTYVNNNTAHAVLFDATLNDTRRGGSSDATGRKIINCLQSIFVNQFSKNNQDGGCTSCLVTRYGTWSTVYTAAALGGKSVNKGAFTTTNNDSITYGPFTDTTVYVRLMGADGTTNTYATFDIYIDNVLKGHYTENFQTDGISDGVYDNKRIPMALIYTGLGAGPHTIKVVNTSATSGTLYLVVDGFGTLRDATTATPFILGEAAYLNSAGYAVTPSSGSTAATDIMNAKIDSLVATWPQSYPVFVAKLYNYLNTTTGLGPDNIHPNNTGDKQLESGYLGVVPSLTSPTTGAILKAGFDHYAVTYKGVSKKLAWLTDLPAAGNVSSVANSDATLNISPTSGAVVASLNLNHANTWAQPQTENKIILASTGSGDNPGIYNSNSTTGGYAVTTIYPQTGTNVAGQLYLVPKGTGTAGLLFGINLFNKDFIASSSNAEFLQINSTGTAGYLFNSTATGTGTARAISLSVGTHTDQFKLKTDGSISMSGTPVGTGTALMKAADSTIVQMPLSSGSYTPTVTTSTNCAAATQTVAIYTRIGNIVHVNIRGSVTATASATDCAFTVTLPVGTNINVASNEGSGMVGDTIPASVSASSGTVMIIHYLPASTSATPYGISFDYSL